MFNVVMKYHENRTTLVLQEEQYPVEGFTGTCLLRSAEEFHFLEVHLHHHDDVYLLDLYQAEDVSGMGRSPLEALLRAGWTEEHASAAAVSDA